MARDEEPTNEIDLEAMRGSIAAARSPSSPTLEQEAPRTELNTVETEGVATVVVPPTPRVRQGDPITVTKPGPSTAPVEADEDDVEELDEDDITLSPSRISPERALEVAAARAATLGTDETPVHEPPLDKTGEDEALPSFALEENDDDLGDSGTGAWPGIVRNELSASPSTARAFAGDIRHVLRAPTSTGVTAKAAASATSSEPTAVFTGAAQDSPPTDEVPAMVPEEATSAPLAEPPPSRGESGVVTQMRPVTPALMELARTGDALALPVDLDHEEDITEAASEDVADVLDLEDDVAGGEDDVEAAMHVSDSEIELVSEVDPEAESSGSFDVATGEPQLTSGDLDAEEAALLEARRFGPLIALYRQRLSDADTTKKKASILVQIARVYESGTGDATSAFDTLIEAFELAPDNGEVIAEVDRVGRATQRIAELADRVKRKLMPRATDDQRITYLGHLVYWYERVLGRGREVSPLVAEIERYDKVHPVVLKRAAQLAAMNGDAKTQREHLKRALERTVRREERVALQLALADAFAGTADAPKYYEAALEEDPSSLVALQGLKQLGRERENYDQVRWALERQIEVAATDAARIEALIELADLQESKFLKRELAADLLERVVTLDPAHPAALKGLERCYHALRDWPRLARVLTLRAERSSDKKTKTELLMLAAEVHESKLGDLAGAVDVHRSLLVVDPKHRRALGDLARLYEKLGDWGNLATYKARLAELAPTKRAMSQELVKLGEFLSLPERDPIAAQLQYERAVVIDPTNVAGWEALQRIATEAGDDRRVIECLEQRRDHTDVPRQRAVVLVDLAKIHLKRGDADAAQKAFEAAVRADHTNEQAAIAMLDAYTAEARWAEAAPLCELLVNAAVRDRDAEALFIRLRLATRIAAALGDADRAMMSALSALDARPTDADAQADLVVVASQCRESAPAALAKGRAHLARIAASPEGLGVENLRKLGALLHDGSDFDNAAAVLERAADLQPDDANITRELADVYLAQGDFPRACKLKVDVARNATNIDVRFDLLCEAGEIWARRAEELETAASVLEEARAIKPHDSWLLQTMRWLYGELGDWPLLASILEETVRAQESASEKPAERVKTLLALAEVLRDKLGDRSRAADVYDQILDIDTKRLDLFEEIVGVLTEAKDWERLEHAYRRMAERAKQADQQDLEFALLQQLGLIYRDRLGDAERAYQALDAATRLRPEDGEVRKIVVELLVVTDNLDSAVARLRSEIDRDPHDAQLYGELYELFLRQLAFDKAWCAVNVLCRLTEPTPEQRRFHEDYAPMPLDGVPGQIVEQAWQSHILHADLDPTLTSLFALMTPVVARMRWGQLRPEQRVGRPFTPNHSRLHDVVRTTFENASEILSMETPDLLLAEPSAGVPFAPALGPYGSILVCAPAVEAEASSLIFLVAKRLAEQRPELAARGFFPSVPELTALLNTAMRVSRNEIAKDPASASLDQSFAAVLSPQEGSELRSITLQASSNGRPLDVKTWLRAADFSSTRAGLLIAGDIEPARTAILAESSGEREARERIGELYKFATSDLHAELRTAIGVAVQG